MSSFYAARTFRQTVCLREKAKRNPLRCEQRERLMNMEVFLIGGIVAICLFCCAVEGIVWVWEKLETLAEDKEVRERERYRRA